MRWLRGDGALMAHFDDVTHRLGYFERRFAFYSQADLVSEITRHYSQQVCGVVWCGVMWCDVVWCGVVWCGVVWCRIMRHGMMWFDG